MISKMYRFLDNFRFTKRLCSGCPRKLQKCVSDFLGDNVEAPSVTSDGNQNQKPDYDVTRKICYGQPAPSTHPHLLKKFEVTPGISKKEFCERRIKFMEKISRKNVSTAHHLVVIPSATKVYMSDKIPYPFRQNTDFTYLSGFLEPDSILVLHNVGNKDDLKLPDHKSVLFVPKKEEHSELWDGPRSGTEGSVELTGVDEAFDLDDFGRFISNFLRSSKNFSLWYDHDMPMSTKIKRSLIDLVNENRHARMDNPSMFVQELRLIKSEAEIALVRKSCQIASQSLTDVIKASHPMVTESLLNAKMEFESKIRGAEWLAFPPVVAGGNRANIIHYIKNDQKIFPRELVLMDAGCEYHGYASDMTRTWPVNGRYSPAQRDLYDAVVEVQQDLIQLCHKFVSLDDLYKQMNHLISLKLRELCILPNGLSENEIYQMTFKHCPHHVSHYLGMDVHDTPLVSRNIPLRPGMVITVEPGIYVDENCQHSPRRYRGLGIRIEDDILITDNGPVVLTSECPKESANIEKLFVETC